MIKPGRVAALLLCAGQSARFGPTDKLLAVLDGLPLVVHAARRITRLDPGRKIAVCAEGRVAGLLEPMGFEIVINRAAEQGLSTSLGCGVEAVEQGDCEAALVCLGDMPFVSAGHFGELLARFDPVEAPNIASAANGVAMPPALFARACFDQLRAQRGDRGAGKLLASAVQVPAPPGELADIDTIEDLWGVRPRRAGDRGICPA